MILPLRGHKGPIFFAKFSPDDSRIITASRNTGEIKLWDAKTGTCLMTEDNPTGDNYDATVSFSPDGKTVISGSNMYTGVKDGKPTGAEPGVSGIKYRPLMWDAATGKAITNNYFHDAFIVNGEYSPDGRKVMTVSFDSVVRIWDANSGQLLTTCKAVHELPTYTEFSPDGQKIAMSFLNGTAGIWSVATGKKLLELTGHLDDVNTARFSPNNKFILTTQQIIPKRNGMPIQANCYILFLGWTVLITWCWINMNATMAHPQRGNFFTIPAEMK
jgi:WD40 repeat protein